MASYWKFLLFVSFIFFCNYVTVTVGADCDYNPCQNNGTCSNSTETGLYNCTCEAGFSGNNCETSDSESDVCDSSPCQNGGQCTISSPMEYQCTCANGYEGDECSVNTDDCSPNPCQNGGTCEDDVAGYVCSCAAGFTGTTCDSADEDTTDGTGTPGTLTCILCSTTQVLSRSASLEDSYFDFGNDQNVNECVAGNTNTTTCTGSNPMCIILESLYSISAHPNSTDAAATSASVKTVMHDCVMNQEYAEMSNAYFNGTCRARQEAQISDLQRSAMLMSLRNAGWTDADTLTVEYGGCNCNTTNCNTLGLQDEVDEDEESHASTNIISVISMISPIILLLATN